MNTRMRKLIGTIVTVAFLICYCLLAMVVGSAVLLRANGIVQGLYFVAAGFAWLPLVMVVIRWMVKSPD